MAANHLKNATTNQKTVLVVGGVFKKRHKKGDGNEGGGQATATRAMAMTTATVMTWTIAKAMRLVGDEEGKGEGSKGNGDSNEGGE